MSLLHPLLLLGLGLMLVPVVLHLLMKARPKKFDFPALRLIQNRRQTTARRLRLRHLWLLLLRMGVVGALVFVVARPRVPAGDWSLSWGDWLRLLGVLAGVGMAYGIGGKVLRRQPVSPPELALKKTVLTAGIAVAGLVGLLLVFALPYRQRVWASMANPGVVVDATQPVTAVMLFDTSLSMGYQLESQTRLEVARDIAQRHLKSLPRGSRLAICDTSSDGLIRFAPDLLGASRRVETLELSPLFRPLEDRILAALDAHLEDRRQVAPANPSESTQATESDDRIREIYVFTDLTANAFRADALPRLKEVLAAQGGVGLYFIDVGVENSSNAGLTDLMLTDQSVAVGSELNIQARVDAQGASQGEKVVELSVLDSTGQMVRQGPPQTIQVDGTGGATAQFILRPQASGVLQGELRLVASDPLSFDDTRAFTVAVHPPAEILLVCDNPGEARFVLEALAPQDLVERGQGPFRCQVMRSGQLSNTDLSRYSVVALLNVADPGPAGWKSLTDYVASGGSALVVLGDRVNHPAYLTDQALAVLPGQLGAPLAFRPAEYLDLRDLNHPLLKRFDDWGAGGLKAEPILRYWRVDPTADTAVIARYTDPRQGPALIERAVGRGRVLLLTTPLDRRGWNDLPVVGWEFVGLVDQMMTYLGRAGRSQFNHLAGAEVLVPLEPGHSFARSLLRKPGLQQLPGDIPANAPSVRLAELDQLGNYRLILGEGAATLEQGFSVNPDGKESLLDRLTSADLDERLGSERYSLAKTVENLRRNVQTGREGHEVFPFLGVLLLAIFLGEHFVANHFYDSERAKADNPSQRAAPASKSPTPRGDRAPTPAA
jgi:hypothetical protein